MVISPNEILKPTLTTGVDYISSSNNTELISTTYDVLKTISMITDENTNDADVLDISTEQKVVTTPTVYGIEFINFDIEHKTPTEEATVTVIVTNSTLATSGENVYYVTTSGN